MKNKIIDAKSYQIQFGLIENSSFKSLLIQNYADSKKVILVDENTQKYCLENLLTRFEELKNAEIIIIPAGESNKTLEICIQVWEALSDYKIGRNDLIINLGGGLVSDMGGFIASLYKRGLDFINIPTSLLAMVDASIGGKTGIDFFNYKNQLGVFSFPKALFIDCTFLETLPLIEKQNAYAEMLKHGLINDKNHWEALVQINNLDELNENLIIQSVDIKNKIVLKDPFEKNERKKLNFGHTFGHAIESFLLGTKNEIPHGQAVALGMICESYVSFKQNLLNQSEFEFIENFLLKRYQIPSIDSSNFNVILDLMLQDKKNSNQKILLVLLKTIGESTIGNITDDSLILETLSRYFKNEKK